MKILHTGDLHLDSPFCAYGARDAERQRELGRGLLERIFRTAAEEGCELMLMSGDVFDGKIVSPETGELFCSLIETYKIPVVISPGNHDPYFEGCFYAKAVERLGELLSVFSAEELQVLDLDALRVRVFGYGFNSRMLASNPLSGAVLPEDNGYTRVFCGHCDIDMPLSRIAPISLNELKSYDFDYAALGHVHNKWKDDLGSEKIRYCGFAEGRSFDELGEGGAWIVDITDGECTVVRKILARKSFYILDTEVSVEDDGSALFEKICDLIRRQDYPAGAHMRLVLEGNAEESAVSELISASDKICASAGVEYIEIIDRTVPLLDGEYLEKDITLRGELYRLLKPKLMSSDGEERDRALRALKIGLAAIDGRSIYGAGRGGNK